MKEAWDALKAIESGMPFQYLDDQIAPALRQALEKKPETLGDYIRKHMIDNINPNHYRQGEIECIDAIKAATINKTGIEAVCTANAVKYLWRYESKNGLEDVRKAQWYINRLVSELEKKQQQGTDPK